MREKMGEPIAAFIGGVASLGNAAAALISASDTAKRNALLIEFQQALIQVNTSAAATQVQNASLVKRNQDLEDEIVRMKNWGTEAQKYETVEVARGVFAKLQKERMGIFESQQKLCCNCFAQGEESLLQQTREPERIIGLICHRCKAKVTMRHYKDAE